MPPRAIASRVREAIVSAAASPVRSWWRSSASNTIDGGNFGAPLKPACSSSNWPTSRLSAASRSSAVADLRPERLLRPAGERLDDPRAGVQHVAPLLRPRLGDRVEQLEELPAREERPGVERRAVRGEEDGHRPAALAGERRGGLHVHGVDVRAFLPVDLDVDEVLVHHRRDVVALERVVRHDVTPVAGGVADRQQDRDVPAARLLERLVAPLDPVDRVVGVLAQVRAGRGCRRFGTRPPVPHRGR